MTTEDENYKINLETFVNKLENAKLYKIILLLDFKPTFDLKIIPFKFDYADCATLITDRGIYKVFTTMTSDSYDTFWIEQVEEVDNDGKIQEVNSTIKAISFETKKDFRHPFKMKMQLDNNEFFLYCGELYDDICGRLKYKIYDEMILAFDNRQDAIKFEELIN